MSRYDMTDKSGFILNAKGCELLYDELQKLEKPDGSLGIDMTKAMVVLEFAKTEIEKTISV